MFYLKYRHIILFASVFVIISTLAVFTYKFHAGSGSSFKGAYKGSNTVNMAEKENGNSKSNEILYENKELKILMYHHVSDNISGEKYYYVSPSSFFDQMKYLSDNGYTALTFDALKNYKMYKKPVMITFDDGYMDNYTYAYPVLKRFNIKATIFLIVGSINHPDFLTAEQINIMTDFISFQSHTINHLNLSLVDDKTIEKECCESKDAIERLLSGKVNTIAYPYGLYNDKAVNIAKKYYDYCVAGNEGSYSEGDDDHKINRIPVTCADTLDDFIKKVK